MAATASGGTGIPDESSPLLRRDSDSESGTGNHDGGQVVGDEGIVESAPAGTDNGRPKVNMALFFPAVGVGVSRSIMLQTSNRMLKLTLKITKIFLMTLDQLLTVASYAKIGSELHALNSTSWIATS